MPLAPKSYQDVYKIIRTKVESRYPNADFNEGSFNDLYTGAISLAYQELQALALDNFKKTFFQNSATTGTDLETLAVDHFHEGARRPQATKAIGTLVVTRDTGNNSLITIPTGTVFTSNEKNFVSTSDVSIIIGNDTGNVPVEAEEAGVAGNLESGQTWKSSLADVTVTNPEEFQGGQAELNDDEYRDFIKNFIESLQDGTATGLQGSALLVPGVNDARVIRKLVDVGTLDNTGALKTTGVVKFKAVLLYLYVASGTNSNVNSAVRSAVETKVKNQLSAGETISVISATPRAIDWDVTLTFVSSTQALALAKKREDLKQAFATAINDLSIGTDFDRAAMATKVLTDNGWTGLFAIVTNTPSGNITIAENEKAVSGTITVRFA